MIFSSPVAGKKWLKSKNFSLLWVIPEGFVAYGITLFRVEYSIHENRLLSRCAVLFVGLGLI
jgi:hypothetical protein